VGVAGRLVSRQHLIGRCRHRCDLPR